MRLEHQRQSRQPAADLFDAFASRGALASIVDTSQQRTVGQVSLNETEQRRRAFLTPSSAGNLLLAVLMNPPRVFLKLAGIVGLLLGIALSLI